MIAEEKIREVLIAWENAPLMSGCESDKDAALAGKTIIEILKWILEDMEDTEENDKIRGIANKMFELSGGYCDCVPESALVKFGKRVLEECKKIGR